MKKTEKNGEKSLCIFYMLQLSRSHGAHAAATGAQLSIEVDSNNLFWKSAKIDFLLFDAASTGGGIPPPKG